MPESIYDVFANDQLKDDNVGIPGYDNSPEVLQRGIELNQRFHKEFLETLKGI